MSETPQLFLISALKMGGRLALGAQPRRVVQTVMRETLALVFVGVVLGLIGARVAVQVLTMMYAQYAGHVA